MSNLYDALSTGNLRMSVTINGEDLMDFVRTAFKEMQEEERIKREEMERDTNLSREEARDLLGVCDTTLWTWAKRGILVPHKVGHRSLYKKSEVMAMLNGKNKGCYGK